MGRLINRKIRFNAKIKEKDMFNRCLTLIVLIVALVMLPSCGGKPLVQKDTMLDKNWGRSYESAKYNQMLNPEAGKNLEPVVCTDGQTAERTVEKYRKGESKKHQSK